MARLIIVYGNDLASIRPAATGGLVMCTRDRYYGASFGKEIPDAALSHARRWRAVCVDID